MVNLSGKSSKTICGFQGVSRVGHHNGQISVKIRVRAFLLLDPLSCSLMTKALGYPLLAVDFRFGCLPIRDPSCNPFGLLTQFPSH